MLRQELAVTSHKPCLRICVLTVQSNRSPVTASVLLGDHDGFSPRVEVNEKKKKVFKQRMYHKEKIMFSFVILTEG